MKRNKISVYYYFLAVALAALVTLAFLWFLILNKIVALKNKGGEMYFEANAAELKIKKNKELKSLLGSLNEGENTLAEIIITKDKIIDLVKSAEALAADAGVELKIHSVQAPSETENSPFYIRFEAKGDFQKIYKFIKMTENTPYLSSFGRAVLQKTATVNIAPAEIGGQEDEQKKQIWILNADLKILSYKP